MNTQGESNQTSANTQDLTQPVRRAAILLIALALAGLPASYILALAVLQEAQAEPALITSAWVLFVALIALVPLSLARTAPPAQQINARLGHVLIRLLLTAGGLIAYLLSLPEPDRLPVGLFGLGWYAVTWVIDFTMLRVNAAQVAT